MTIQLHQFTIRQIVDGYANNDEEGIVGFGGRLDIRPKYQRNFVYNERQKMAVMDTVWKGFPLNVMYWVKTGEDSYELLDGQQRTLSICSFIAGEFMMNFDGNLLGWSNMSPDRQRRILDYTLQIYICEGTPSEQLDWFRIINIAGEKLTAQELLNAVYSGEWVTSAKRYFSKTCCVAQLSAGDYLSGTPIRQEYLETALKWVSDAEYGAPDIERYMAEHQHDQTADILWQYFDEVISWVRRLFTVYYKDMKGIDWGLLYNRYKTSSYEATVLGKKVKTLMDDPAVNNRKGIFEFLLGGESDTRLLNVRIFDRTTKRTVYQRQTAEALKNGTSNCPLCASSNNAADRVRIWEEKDMEADHVTAWSNGGNTDISNCQMLCRTHNRAKGNS